VKREESLFDPENVYEKGDTLFLIQEGPMQNGGILFLIQERPMKNRETSF